MITETLSAIPTWTALILTLFTSVYLYLHLARPKQPPFPLITPSPTEIRTNARTLITTALADHNNEPVTIRLPHGQKILLPSTLTSWVKSNKSLDHVQLVKDDFFAGIPGFEANTLLHDGPDNNLAKRIIATKLGQNESTIQAINDSVARGLATLWGGQSGDTCDAQQWHVIDWQTHTMGLIARAASAVFVGPEKADDDEWLHLVQGYVVSYFTAVGELHTYPPWTRRVVHWFLPSAQACRRAVPRARRIMKEVLEKRRRDEERAKMADGHGGVKVPEYNDALAWAEAGFKGQVEAGDLQLSLAMAAFFTTTEMLRAVLVEIARRPDLAEELRKEVGQKIGENGVSVAAVNNMVLMDSVLKESQRLSAGSVVLERTALKDTVLPNGKIIPRGSQIMVDSTNLWNPDVFPNPHQFDEYRFLRKREAGDPSTQFVQSSSEYHVFGGGRHICPGRFFAAIELKLVLAHVLLKYDIRLAKGCDPKPVSNGFFAMVDPTVQLEVRKRTGQETDGLLLG